MWCRDMRVVAVVVVCFLVVGLDGGRVGAALPRFDSTQRTYATGGPIPSALRRRTVADLLTEDPSLCFSLRENEDQRQLLCNDRRSKFNYNPLSLRFGKRYIYKKSLRNARNNKFVPLFLFSRELEVPT